VFDRVGVGKKKVIQILVVWGTGSGGGKDWKAFKGFVLLLSWDTSHFPFSVTEEPGLEKGMPGTMYFILLTPPLNYKCNNISCCLSMKQITDFLSCRSFALQPLQMVTHQRYRLCIQSG